MSEDKKIKKQWLITWSIRKRAFISAKWKSYSKEWSNTSKNKAKENLNIKSSEETLDNEKNDTKKPESKNIEKNQIKSKTLTGQTKAEDSKLKKNNESEKKANGLKQNQNDVGVKNSDQMNLSKS